MSTSSTTLCSAEPTCVQCSLSIDLVAQCIRKLWAPSIQAFHGLCNYCMRKKAVLIPSTLEGEADGIQKINRFHISTVLWKCGKMLSPLYQGAKNQARFPLFFMVMENNIYLLWWRSNSQFCEQLHVLWVAIKIKSKPALTGTSKVFPSVCRHAEFSAYCFEVVGRRGSTDLLNHSNVFSGFFVLTHRTAGEGVL